MIIVVVVAGVLIFIMIDIFLVSNAINKTDNKIVCLYYWFCVSKPEQEMQERLRDSSCEMDVVAPGASRKFEKAWKMELLQQAANILTLKASQFLLEVI